MTEQQPTFPSISQSTRQKLASEGLVNHLYDYLDLPSFYITRGKGFDAYTYLIMGLSLVGGVMARRYGHLPNIFVAAFCLAPSVALLQKKQTDTFENSTMSKLNPRILLQNYPILKESFNQVLAEVDAEIAKVTQRIRILEGKTNRN